MAKFGEGDERWIVKEREDGKNCNGWHWSEVNLNDWSKERLKELLCVAIVENSTGVCKVTEMEKCSGDVTVQSRKQKKFPLYELEIVLKWEGQLLDADVRAPLHTRIQARHACLSPEPLTRTLLHVITGWDQARCQGQGQDPGPERRDLR